MTTNVISSDSANSELLSLLKLVAETEDIKDFKITTAMGSAKGDGYVGVINSAQIVGKDDKNGSKVLHVIVKSAKSSDTLREAIPVKVVFQREIYAYERIFPAYRELEIEKEVTPTRFSPKFYKGEVIEKKEALVLENLNEIGYKLHERRVPMDEAHVSVVMAQYGRLHALSFALKDQYPTTYKMIISPIYDIFIKFMKDANFMHSLLYRYKKSLETLDSAVDEEALKRCEAFGIQADSFVYGLPDSVDEYSAILHGDGWITNMMFKYDKTHSPNKPIRVDFLDFQLVKMGSPVVELSYFFYSCSSKAVIDNLEYYLRLYYDSFAMHLRKLESDPEKLFPYKVLKEHWKKYAKYGLFLAASLIHVMLSEKDETIDYSDVLDSGASISEAFNYELSDSDKYNDRIKHILLHFVKHNFV